MFDGFVLTNIGSGRHVLYERCANLHSCVAASLCWLASPNLNSSLINIYWLNTTRIASENFNGHRQALMDNKWWVTTRFLRYIWQNTRRLGGANYRLTRKCRDFDKRHTIRRLNQIKQYKLSIPFDWILRYIPVSFYRSAISIQ